jgi:hypothetical protein
MLREELERTNARRLKEEFRTAASKSVSVDPHLRQARKENAEPTTDVVTTDSLVHEPEMKAPSRESPDPAR